MAKKIINRTREEVIKRWIKALRSGKYKQTEGRLRDIGGFCCLGVLCDLAAQDGGPKWETDNYIDFEYRNSYEFPPSNIQKFIFGELDHPFMRELVTLNDESEDFKEIANIIENKLVNNLNAKKTTKKKNR